MIHHRSLPLRVKLTLWYSLVFAAALFTLGFVCLWMVHRATDDLEKNELQQRVRSVRRFLEARPTETVEQRHAAMTAAYDVSHGSKWLQVIDEHGNWLYRSAHVAAAYRSLVLPQLAPKAGNYFAYTAESIHVRALIETIDVNGVHYTVQTGLSLTKTLVVLSNFRVQLSVFMIVGLLASSLAGYFISRKALSPIASLAFEAQRINDKNLNSRLPELNSRDELASLSITLNQMLGRIEAGYQSVRSFTANAAHELRSPIALVRAETEVALAFPRDADYYRNTCQRVLGNAVQMTALIDQLLTLARADAGVEILRLQAVNLTDLMEEVADEWSDRFKQAEIRFTRQFETPELWIDADYLAVKRLLNILLENAWRYTPSGRSVTFACSERLQGAELIGAEIGVADTGIGICAEDQTRIFQRFYRAAEPLHGDHPGSGLGLVLAQWIADRHGWSLQVESVLDEGTCFSVLTETAISEMRMGTDIGEAEDHEYQATHPGL